MPITVKHEADLGGLAALALLAGQLQGSAARQRPQGFTAAPGGRGGRGASVRQDTGGLSTQAPSQTHYDRLVAEAERRRAAEFDVRQQAGLQAQEITQRKEAELELAQEQQRSEAWVYEYSPQQRREIARYTNELQQIAGDPTLTEAEKAVATRQSQARIDAIQPVRRPRTNEEQMQEMYTQLDGAPMGQPFVDQNTGALLVRKPDFELQLLVRPDQLPQAKLFEKQQAVMEKRRDLFWKEKKDLANAGKSDEQLKLEIARVFPLPEEPSSGMALPDEAEPPAAPSPELVLEGMKAQGLPVKPADFSLPSEVAQAQVMLRAIRDKYDGKRPPADAPNDIKELWEQCSAILISYAAQQEQQVQPEAATEPQTPKAGTEFPWGGYHFGI